MIQRSPLQSSTEIQQQPLITVITVSFNAVKTIEQTMLSVLNQTYPNIEYIIIDGGSTDGTVDIIKKYADRLAYWVSEPDKGIYDAMNKGIDKATGEWINFMNCGDSFANTQVVDNLFHQKIAEEIAFLCGDTLYTYKNCTKLLKFVNDRYHSVMPACHQSIFCRKNLLLQYPFDTSYKIAADYKFFYELWKKGYSYDYRKIVVANCDASNGLSKINPIETRREILMISCRPLECHIRLLLYRIKILLRTLLIKLKLYR